MYFVFMEFLDNKVEETLRKLRDALQPWKSSKSPIHVTVRGPYQNEPDSRYLNDIASRLTGQGVRIIGAGYFSHGTHFSVFLRAESAIFKEVWWKPDYRSPLLDIQPHITIFESDDRESAMLVVNFLKAARISIHTTSVQLSVYSATEPDLFGTRLIGNLPSKISEMQDIVAIDEEIIARARELGNELMERRDDLNNRKS